MTNPTPCEPPTLPPLPTAVGWRAIVAPLRQEPRRWATVLAATLVALVCLGALLGAEEALPLKVLPPPSANSETEVAAEGSGRPAALSALRSLEVALRALRLLQEHYVEPDKFKPRVMLEEALQSMAHLVPEMLVDVPERDAQGLPKLLRARVGVAEQLFHIENTSDLYGVGWHLLVAARFVAAYLPPEVPAAKVQYTAFNGILQTLDPYSRLLDPEQWREMQTTTVGNFGGLGIVILPIDGVLTVQTVLPDSPAQKSGIEPGDKIQQIDGEDTLNMSVDAAVERLRGEVGTTAHLVIARKGWEMPQAFAVVRMVIHLQSVESKVLDNGVAYARVKGFQRGTAAELGEAIDNLLRAGAHPALVLDLRDNPGGLLDEAIRICDLFIARGPAVTTVTGGKQRDVRMVTGTGRFTHLPLAVLLNGHSASASEVVAGALKYSGRAFVVGEQSFGKGSVQVPYEIAGGAFKMTIAKYLVPGDISIHGKGIEPDIGIQFVSATREQISLFGGPRYSRATRRARAALESQVPPKPKVLQKVLLPDLADRDRPDADTPADVIEREPRQRAAAILRRVGQPSAKATLEAAQADVEDMARRDDADLVAHLKRQGVDWRSGEAAEAEQLKVEIVDQDQKLDVQAGDILRFSVTITNTGKAPATRIHILTRCDDPSLDGHEQLVGRLEPGQNRTVPLSVRVSLRHSDVQVPLEVGVAQDGRVLGRQDSTLLTVHGRPVPEFAFRLKLDDVATGKGADADGVLQPGETAGLVVEIQNIGPGLTQAGMVRLRSLSGQRLHLVDGRSRFGPLVSGATATVRLAVRGVDLESRDGKTAPASDWEPARLELSISDESLGVERQQVLEIPWGRHALATAPATQRQRLTESITRAATTWNIAPGIEILGPQPPAPLQATGASTANAVCWYDLQARVHFDPASPERRFVTASVAGDKQFYLNADARGELATRARLRLEPGLNAVTVQAQAGPRRDSEKTLWVHCSARPEAARAGANPALAVP